MVYASFQKSEALIQTINSRALLRTPTKTTPQAIETTIYSPEPPDSQLQLNLSVVGYAGDTRNSFTPSLHPKQQQTHLIYGLAVAVAVAVAGMQT